MSASFVQEALELFNDDLQAEGDYFCLQYLSTRIWYQSRGKRETSWSSRLFWFHI